MDPRATPFADLLQLNARLLANCVDGLSEAQAHHRVLPELNSVAFLVAHLTDARHMLLRTLGGNAENPLADFLANARSIDDVAELPPVPEMLAAWRAVDRAIAEHMETMSSASWEATTAQRFPGVPQTVLGALAFLVQHDSYHVGQLALLRRAHGLPAMRYGRG